MAVDLWLLTHEDLRHTARVRALSDWLTDSLGRERDLFEGRRPRAPVGVTAAATRGKHRSAV